MVSAVIGLGLGLAFCCLVVLVVGHVGVSGVDVVVLVGVLVVALVVGVLVVALVGVFVVAVGLVYVVGVVVVAVAVLAVLGRGRKMWWGRWEAVWGRE